MSSFPPASVPRRDAASTDLVGSDQPQRLTSGASASDAAASTLRPVPLCWPFPLGSQNHTDKAVKLKPYVPPKRRSLNQY